MPRQVITQKDIDKKTLLTALKSQLRQEIDYCNSQIDWNEKQLLENKTKKTHFEKQLIDIDKLLE